MVILFSYCLKLTHFLLPILLGTAPTSFSASEEVVLSAKGHAKKKKVSFSELPLFANLKSTMLFHRALPSAH